MMKRLDIAQNYRFGDNDVCQLMVRCPNLQFLGALDTGVTMEIITELARKWGHCLHSLALPNVAACHLKRIYRDDGAALKHVVTCIRSMPALIYLRMGQWRMGTTPETHRFYNGGLSSDIVEEIQTATMLKTLFRELTIHLSPYAPEDKEFYKRNGFPKPNLKFPPLLDPHHYFRRWGRCGENFTLEDTCWNEHCDYG